MHAVVRRFLNTSPSSPTSAVSEKCVSAEDEHAHAHDTDNDDYDDRVQ